MFSGGACFLRCIQFFFTKTLAIPNQMTKLNSVGYSPIWLSYRFKWWAFHPFDDNLQVKNNGTSTDASDHIETTEL